MKDRTFEHQAEVDSVSTLPEHYRPQTIEGVMPGQVGYFYMHCIKADRDTGQIYLVKSTEFKPEEHILDDNSPNYARSSKADGSYVGVSQVYRDDEQGQLLDGFIVDMRFVKPGALAQ